MTAITVVIPHSVSADEGDEFTTKLYSIAHLIPSSLDLSMPSDLSSPDVKAPATSRGGGGGFGGGGFGRGGGFGGGGGMFCVPHQGTGDAGSSHLAPHRAFQTEQRLSPERILDLIVDHTAELREVKWQDYHGEEGGIASLFGNHLLVTQTDRGHREVAQLLEVMNRSDEGTLPIKVELCVIELPAEEKNSSTEELVSWVNSDSAKLVTMNCVNHHATYIASGISRTYTASVIPVVGGNGLSEGASSVGYQPLIQTMQLGLSVSARPDIDGGGKSGKVDLRVLLTAGPEEITSKQAGETEIDKVEIESSEINATIKSAPNTWVVAGTAPLVNPHSLGTIDDPVNHTFVLARWSITK